MSSKILIAALLAGGCGAAMAGGHVNWSVNINAPIGPGVVVGTTVGNAPVYRYRRPPPPPVYYPAPVVYQPAYVAYRPAPVYVPAPAYGYRYEKRGRPCRGHGHHHHDHDD